MPTIDELIANVAAKRAAFDAKNTERYLAEEACSQASIELGVAQDELTAALTASIDAKVTEIKG